MLYFETSAMSGVGITQMFSSIGNQLISLTPNPTERVETEVKNPGKFEL